jgi:hypothetical protein
VKRLATFAAAVLLLLLGAPAPAQADAIEWNMAPCVEPRLGGFHWDHTGKVLVLRGTGTECPPAVEHGGFALATYRPGGETGSAPGYNIRLFETAGGGDTLTFDEYPVFRDFGAVVVPNREGEYGVCMLAGADERIQCVLATVARDSSGNWVGTTEPLATDAPLVDRVARIGEYTGAVRPPVKEGGPVGNCGTCF